MNACCPSPPPQTYSVAAGDSVKSPAPRTGILKDEAMNSTSPGLHVDLLPPHVKEEENGLGVLRNSVGPGRAPGETDRQISNILLHHLLSYSRRNPVATKHALLQIWGTPLQLYPPRWVGWGQRTAEPSPQDTPTALSKACHHLRSHLHHAQLQRVQEQGVHGHIEDVGCDPCQNLRQNDRLEAKERFLEFASPALPKRPCREHRGHLHCCPGRKPRRQLLFQAKLDRVRHADGSVQGSELLQSPQFRVGR